MARARLYELGDLGDQKFKGQAALIVKALQDKSPQTVAELAEVIAKDLVTRQDPLRVVSFYISTWKKRGLIKAVDGEPEPTTEPNAETDEPITSGPDEMPGVSEPTPEEQHAHEVLATCSIRDAVIQVLDLVGHPMTPQAMASTLQVHGRTVTANQVADAARKLLRRGELKRFDDGTYEPIPTA